MKEAIQKELEQIREQGLYRRTRLIRGRQSAWVEMGGKRVLLLCSNNYLGLADHPALIEAAASAATQFGVSSSASRLVSGTMELHERLEAALAGFKQTPAALVFNSGYAANTGIIPALAGRGDVIFSDRLNHASIVDGALLSGARLVRYPHNDTNALARLLEKHRGTGRALIVTDGVFSMDGDIAPLREIAKLKTEHKALLMVDDAHGSGVLGEQGRGAAEMMGAADGVDIQMGTFGKALGSYGAYAAVSQELRELLLNRARSFIFSTSLPPAVLAASLAAVELVQSAEGAGLRERLRRNSDQFRKSMGSAGFIIPDGDTQIVPLMTRDSDTTMRFSELLLDEGLYVQGIRPPTVPAGSCRLRFTLMATHGHDDLSWAAERIVAVGQRLGVV